MASPAQDKREGPMANDVFANGREISCKKADGKSIAAFPDVCFTPPTAPPTPPGAPIPYPNTAFAKDTAKGSKTVKISGNEVMLKNSSYFKTSTGNEAGNAPKKGIMTSKIKGKAYFTMWSMDVKAEGENVCRHLDATTHNHGSSTNTAPWAYADSGAFASSENCADARENIEKKCTGDKKKDCAKPKGQSFKSNPCVQAKRCQLVPYRPKSGCCPGQTAHHLVPKRAFKGLAQKSGKTKYKSRNAPCVCAEGHSWHRNDKSKYANSQKTHPDLHDVQDYLEREARNNPTLGRSPDRALSYAEARDTGVAAHQAVFPNAGCDPECLKDQLDKYHKDEVGVEEGELVRTPSGLRRLKTILEKAREPNLLAKTRDNLKKIKEAAEKAFNSGALH